MADEMILDGKTYVSSKRATDLTKYTRDYVGQMCRAGVVDCQRVGSAWFIEKDSLVDHASRGGKWAKDRKKDAEAPDTSTAVRKSTTQETIDVEGKEYISSARASKLTGYSQDYVGQLARGGKVLSKSVGNRWYVSREDLERHKREADAQLATMQAQSVGISHPRQEENQKMVENKEEVKTHFSYTQDDRPLFPTIEKPQATHSMPEVEVSDIKKEAQSLDTDNTHWEKVSIQKPRMTPPTQTSVPYQPVRAYKPQKPKNAYTYSDIGNSSLPPKSTPQPQKKKQSSKIVFLIAGIAVIATFALMVFGLPGSFSSDRLVMIDGETSHVERESYHPALEKFLSILTSHTEYSQQ